VLLSAGAGAPGQVFGVGDDQIVGHFGSHYLSRCRKSAGGKQWVRSLGTATRPDLLINEIGAYTGTVVWAPGLYKVTADGDWSATLK
jgi:hypothetical protein